MAGSGLTLTSKPKGELKAYEPSLRDKLAWLLSDTFGGDDRSRVNWINDKVRGGADFVPGVGDAIGIDETKRAWDEGKYGEAVLNGVTTAAGAIPGGGDLAAAGLKGGASMAGTVLGAMAKHWERGGRAPKYKDLREMFHGTASRDPFDNLSLQGRDVGIHTTDNPDLASFYANLADDKAPEDALHSRIYPVIVDAGKTLRGDFVDGGNWGEQVSVMHALKDNNADRPFFGRGLNDFNELKDAKWAEGVSPDTKKIFDDIVQGAGLEESMLQRGYDSLEYSHEPAWNWRDQPVTALMTLDPARIIPRFSPQGLTLSSSPAFRGANRQSRIEDLYGIEDMQDYFRSPDYFAFGEWE